MYASPKRAAPALNIPLHVLYTYTNPLISAQCNINDVNNVPLRNVFHKFSHICYHVPNKRLFSS